jgi:uncharacterized protein YbjT (DUF2867 family)
MILVTGATGTVGREVVMALVERGEAVAGVSRNPAAALPAGARVVHGDPSRPETLRSALGGVHAIFLNPAAVGDGVGELLSLAARLGVERVVLLSGAAVEFRDAWGPIASNFLRMEAAVQASGLEWTCLRPGEFAANTLAWAPQIRATGVVRGPYAEAATPPIHERDIAAAAVLALLGGGHAGRSYTLTGPETLTQRQKLACIAQATGDALLYEEIAPDEALRAMVAQGVPEAIAATVVAYQADCARVPVQPSPTTAALLGRPGLSFAAWAVERQAAFRRGQVAAGQA